MGSAAEREEGGAACRIRDLSASERLSRLNSWLSTFVEAGWMRAQTERAYRGILQDTGIAGLLSRAQTDLQSGIVTNEVVDVVRSLNSDAR